MKIETRNSILKDLKKIPKEQKEKLEEIYQEFKLLDSIADMQNIKKLKGYDNFYRIRLGNYRLGFVIEENKVIFLRFLHRKDIYKLFP